MSVNRVEHVGGGVAWRVRWRLLGIPRRRDFASEQDAEAFLEVHERRLRRLIVVLRVIPLIAAVLALAVGAILVWYAWEDRAVAGDFTRVGGTTRVETAIEASRFWLPQPKHVVTTQSTQSQNVIWRAAECAIGQDAPLLFTPPKRQTSPVSKRERLTRSVIRNWHLPRNALIEVPSQQEEECRQNAREDYVGHLSTLSERDSPLGLPQAVDRSKKLARLVVFAAAKAPGNAPDVAVGLALAAHLAKHRDVSLVVVPRYLQADSRLEAALRARGEAVQDGVILGETRILSADTRTLLRQIVASPDRTSWLAELRTSLGSLEALVAALLALLGLGAASRLATDLAQDHLARVGLPAEPEMEVGKGGKQMTERGGNLWKRIRPDGEAPPEPHVREPEILSDREVTVWLRSRSAITGSYSGRADLGTATFFQLKLDEPKGDVSEKEVPEEDVLEEAPPEPAKRRSLVPPNRGSASDVSEEPRQTADFVLVPVEDIELIWVFPTQQ